VKSTISALIFTLSVAILLAACGGGDRSTTSRDAEKAATLIDAQILLVGNGAEPEALDPHIVVGVPEHHILITLFEGLVSMDPKDLSPIPGVAESWTVSDDLLVYTFKLRDTAKWSNGDPVTANDFLYAWKRILSPDLASEYSYMLFSMKNARAYLEGTVDDFNQVGAKALDDHTLEVTLENPTPYFLQLHIHYSWFPLHRKTIEAFGTTTERNTKWTRPENMVSNGPFTLTRWEPNNVIETRKSDTYWNKDTVKLNGVNFYPIGNEQTEDRMFRAAELHITENVHVSRVAAYKKNNPELIRTDPWIGSYFYRINIARKPFDDVRVRKALAMAIDRDSITTNILKGGETSGENLTPKNVNSYTAEAGIAFDPVAAQTLLAEAGYPNGVGFPEFSILYNTSEKHKIIAVIIQQMWKEHLGIDVTLENQDWKVYLSSTGNDVKNYDVSRAGWIGDFVDPVNFLELFTSDNGNNRTGWSNAEYDRLIAESFSVADQKQRYALFQQAEAILMDEAPVIPIYHYTRPFLLAPEVHNFHPNILAYLPYHTLYLDTP
jgi:oligopeptide transport system substrate-binding protein